MLRVKDAKIALDFCTRVMGLRALRKLDFADRKFSLYFLQMGWSTKSAPSLANKITAATGASASFWYLMGVRSARHVKLQ